jgi:hypothetical protein
MAAPPPQVVVRRSVRPPSPATVASVRILDGALELGKGGAWRKANEEFRIAPGEALRTSPDGVALVTLPWMHIVVGNGTTVGLTPSTVLSMRLDRGRIEQEATAGDILKVLTPEAEVRGRGHVVVIRVEEPARTLVTVLGGWFRVRAAGHTLSLDAGQGAVAAAGREAEVVDLPPPPAGLSPGSDPVYVEKGRNVRLAWRGSAARYRFDVRTLSGDEVVLSRESETPSAEVPGRWVGTYQWRVASIDAQGMEGVPSPPGLFCVVDN